MDKNFEVKKAEAVGRMKKLGIISETIKQFEQDTPDCSEIGSIGLRRSVAAGLLREW